MYGCIWGGGGGGGQGAPLRYVGIGIVVPREIPQQLFFPRPPVQTSKYSTMYD